MGKNLITSALPPLKPTQVTDLTTGEILSYSEWSNPVQSLLNHVTATVKEYYQVNKDELIETLKSYTKLSPAEYARQNNITPVNVLPREVKAQSRILRLIRHKLVSETAAYVNNENPHKQEPSFAPKINLGAADSQMSQLSITDNVLTLQWKCWDKELLLDFQIPDYILKRQVSKWSLPTVQYSRKTGDIVYYFTVSESCPERAVTGFTAGLDLGRVEPFTMVVVNGKQARVAHYTSSPRLKQLNSKRERLLVERKQILKKLITYKQLQYAPLKQEVLQREADRRRAKIARLGVEVAAVTGAEVTRKLVKHPVSVLNVENLSWVTGARYGSRWNHSRQQEALAHSLARVGVRTVKVNPRNTSQDCAGCGEKLVHDTKTRSVWCAGCKTRLDRDYNAALNIARSTKSYPAPQRDNRDNCNDTTVLQVVETTHKSHTGVTLTSLTT